MKKQEIDLSESSGFYRLARKFMALLAGAQGKEDERRN